jgi:hypothetical protein
MSDDDYGLGLKVHEDAYRELEEELDKAKAELEEVGFRACRVLLERDEAREQRDRLAEAALAVVDRWETPFWKQVEHTGVYIAALRKAVEEVKGGQP